MGRPCRAAGAVMAPADDLFNKAAALFRAYEHRYDPFDLATDFEIAAGMRDKSYLIRMRQIMFALAYSEFGNGNQEEFFRLVQKFNKGAPVGFHLGPKKFSSTKSLRAYLKKGQERIEFRTSKSLRNYQEVAASDLGLGFTTNFSSD
jgi:hypothetical protein